MSSSVRLRIHGAAETVTGSKYELVGDKHRILIDCGVFQGSREWRRRNWDQPSFNPREIDAVILTHAHIDHSGYLPVIVKHGFKGPIYCTSATSELLELLLLDAAHLQQEQARYHNKTGSTKHQPAKPLFDEQDARRTLSLRRTIERDCWQEIVPGLNVYATCAGHILGSVSLTFDAWGKSITFSGDVGQYDVPILPDPAPLQCGEVFICESTYGDRDHPDHSAEDLIEKVIKPALDKRGPIIIPAFAVGRTQNLLYYLAKLEREGRIPMTPVYIDSPMAIDATEIYRRFQHDYDDEASQVLADGEYPLLTERTYFCDSVDRSKALNHKTGSRIIISASGMVTGGRILHHMRRWLPDENTTVLFAGYQAHGTRGRDIQSGKEKVKIFGEYIPVRASIESISGLSAHADRAQLSKWIKSFNGSPHRVLLTHGERDAAEDYASRLWDEFRLAAEIPEFLSEYEF